MGNLPSTLHPPSPSRAPPYSQTRLSLTTNTSAFASTAALCGTPAFFLTLTFHNHTPHPLTIKTRDTILDLDAALLSDVFDFVDTATGEKPYRPPYHPDPARAPPPRLDNRLVSKPPLQDPDDFITVQPEGGTWSVRCCLNGGGRDRGGAKKMKGLKAGHTYTVRVREGVLIRRWWYGEKKHAMREARRAEADVGRLPEPIVVTMEEEGGVEIRVVE